MKNLVSVETSYSVICANSEQELKERMEKLKDRYTEVIAIKPKAPGRSCWYAEVR